MSLATFTTERRQELGLSLSQVAIRSGATKAHIHDIEKGRSDNPTCRMVEKLAAALQVSAVELFRHAMGPEVVLNAITIPPASREQKRRAEDYAKQQTSPERKDQNDECAG